MDYFCCHCFGIFSPLGRRNVLSHQEETGHSHYLFDGEPVSIPGDVIPEQLEQQPEQHPE